MLKNHINDIFAKLHRGNYITLKARNFIDDII